ncbi:hypothetical protein BH10PLA2_BH10PLA2_37100 [soil metagenome]
MRCCPQSFGRSRPILWSLVLASLAVGIVAGLNPESVPQVRAADRPSLSAAVGAGSCAASGCHGGPRDQGVKGSEYSTWAGFDKHASAYSVLFDERSKKIEAALTHSRDVRSMHPENNALCLRCHGLEGARSHPELQADGVSCEACHGPARQWLSQHYLPGWKGLSSDAKRATGFIDTHDLLQRGKACAACHIGDRDKEVNHDLIAAGHPRLTFEYSAYLALEVKHWDDAAERKQYPDFELRTWALGQVLTAQRSLELLAARADDSKRPWPEFAEYDCYACHHDLKERNWRAGQSFKARQPGTPEWGGWLSAMLPVALASSQIDAAPALEARIRAIHQMMGSPIERRAVALAAREAARALEGPAQRLAGDGVKTLELDRLLDELLHPKDNRSDLTWDRATQMYLGLAAAVNASNDRDPHRLAASYQQRVRSIAQLLRFPGGPSPSDRFDSPSNFDPERVRQAFRNLGSSTSR